MNSKSKIWVFSILLFGIMMLFIPATSIANAQEYGYKYGKVNDVYHGDDRYYEEIQYNDRDRYYEDDEYIYEEQYYSSKDQKIASGGDFPRGMLFDLNEPHLFTANTDSASIGVGHINNDSNLDVVVANHDDNSISILLGNEDGTFTEIDDRVIDVSQIDDPPLDAIFDLLLLLKCDDLLEVLYLLFFLLSGDNSTSNLLGNDGDIFTETDDRVIDVSQTRNDIITDLLLLVLLPTCFQ